MFVCQLHLDVDLPTTSKKEPSTVRINKLTPKGCNMTNTIT